MRIRGFEKVSSYTQDIKLPRRGTQYSAGYDFYNNGDDVSIKPSEIVIIPTYTKTYMLPDEYLSIYPRSSLGFKYNTVLVNTVGIIDMDYYNNPSNEGEIFIKLHNRGLDRLIIKHGDAFVQGIFQKYLITDDDHLTLNNINRNGGIGSTTVSPK